MAARDSAGGVPGGAEGRGYGAGRIDTSLLVRKAIANRFAGHGYARGFQARSMIRVRAHVYSGDVSDFSLEIEWDPKKAEENVRKHGVPFIVAATVLRDPLSVTVFDAQHSQDEERWITIGRAASGQYLLVVHTWTDTGVSDAHARIISAREAKNSERQSYEESQ